MNPEKRLRIRNWLYAPGQHYVVRACVEVVRQALLYLRHTAGVLKARSYSKSRNLKLNLGCGPYPKAGWVNIDFSTAADLALDLRRPLPFTSKSCQFIYSEHFFEHLDYPETALLHLRECFRLLQPGGVLSMGVPHGEKYVRLYLQELESGLSDIPPPRTYATWARTPMERLNFIFHQSYREDFSEHRVAYDFNTLERLLAAAGFKDIQQRQFETEIDSAHRSYGSLYIRAQSPAS